MLLSELVREKFVLIEQTSISQKDEFNHVCNILEKENYINSCYLNGLISREKDYPTGLELGEINVAIPHANSENVNESTLFIYINKEGVDFSSMEDPDKKIKVQIIIHIVLTPKEKHMEILSSLINLFQDKEFVSNLLSCQNQYEVVKLFKERGDEQ